MQKTAIIANGDLGNKGFHKKILENADIIICADGGANNADILDIIPDYVIGDMDSIEPLLLEKIKSNGKTKIIKDTDQTRTDTELAIELANSLKPKELIILCATGSRLDHSIANILSLKKVDKGISAKIVDEYNEITLIDESAEISGSEDDNISVIPLTDVSGLSYEGLRWPAKNGKYKFGWFGICNRILGKKAEVTVKKGELLIIKSRD